MGRPASMQEIGGAGPIFMRDRVAIAQALLERRIPSIAAFRENMEAGALISYGFDLMGLFYDIASYVQRLAAGAKPSDMPNEQSPRLYMAANLKTAESLGIPLSDVFVARANEVRECGAASSSSCSAAWRHGRSARAPSRARKFRVSASSMTRRGGRAFGRRCANSATSRVRPSTMNTATARARPTAWRRWWAN